MKPRALAFTLTAALLALATGCQPPGEQPAALPEATAPEPDHPLVDDWRWAARDYDQVRQALVEDALERATDEARLMAVTSKSARSMLVRHAPNASEEERSLLKSLLDRLVPALTRLAQAKDLATARAAFADVTGVLVEWKGALERLDVDRTEPGRSERDGSGRRNDAAGHDLVLVRCDASGETWLAPRGTEIANPYSGERRSCGSVVAE